MILFKYVSNPDFILEDSYIRATQLSALNDPFEANYDKEGLIELVREFDDMSGEEIITHIEENKHKIGVICFSEAKDNLLMWAHYANEHKGALIGFSLYGGSLVSTENLTKENIFSQYAMFKGQCLPVKYRKQPLYKIDAFDRDYSNVCVEGGDRIIFEIFQQKSDEWIYEKEHRITLKLEHADKVTLDKVTLDNTKLLTTKSLLEEDMSKYIEQDKKDKSKWHIFLERIEDRCNRMVYGSLLANLAKDNPNILYLFKLSSSSICSVSYGHKGDMNNIKYYTFPNQTGFFESFKTTTDKKNYTITFCPLQN